MLCPFVRLAATSRARLACALAGATWLGGCSVMPPLPRPASRTEIAANSRVDAARSRSLERAVAGINAQTVRAWINRYTAPADGAPAQNGPRAVYIDVDALARRHLAWQLADELQRAAIAPTPARGVKVSLPAPNRPAAPASEALEIPAVAALPVRPARSLSATISQRPAVLASRATLDDFLAALRARQNELETAESDLARRALEERIRAATRGAVEAISLEPVSPEVALELSNLRLQLLAQLRVPAARKAAATTQIERIEKRLNEIWDAQTQAQNARLRAALEELPARLRREGLQALAAAAAARESQRYYDRLELRRLVEDRLGNALPGAGDTQILRLLLPPARLATANLGAASSFQTQARRAASALATTDEERFDARDRRSLVQSEPLASQSVAQLRAQARRDARQWASRLALNWNARLADASHAPDRTALALQTLFETPTTQN